MDLYEKTVLEKEGGKMSVLSRDDFVARVADFVGDREDDESLSFLEDMNDTYSDMEARGRSDWENKYNDLKAQYDELDGSWRKRYRDRFNGGGELHGFEPNTDAVPNDEEPVKSYEDLFVKEV